MMYLRSENVICDASRFASEVFYKQSELVSFSMAFQFIMWMSIYEFPEVLLIQFSSF